MTGADRVALEKRKKRVLEQKEKPPKKNASKK